MTGWRGPSKPWPRDRVTLSLLVIQWLAVAVTFASSFGGAPWLT